MRSRWRSSRIRTRSSAGRRSSSAIPIFGIEVISHVIQLGSVKVSDGAVRPTPADLPAVDESEVRCFDRATSEAMVEVIKAAAKEGDSLGGVAEVVAHGVPVGLGSHVHWDRKLDGRLAQALMSIHAIKGVGIGMGPEVAVRPGSRVHDEILSLVQAPPG